MSIDGHTRIFDTLAEIRKLKEWLMAFESRLAALEPPPPPPAPDPIEAMARAMWDSLPGSVIAKWDDAHSRAKSDSRAMARAALAALKPDKEMINAAIEYAAPLNIPWANEHRNFFEGLFLAMIAAKIETRK